MSQGKYICAGVVSGKVAALLSFYYGRIRDSEAFATRLLDLLQKNVDPDDPMLLRPLHVLAIAGLEQGKLRKAEQAFEQMLQVRAERPEQRGQVHIIGGALRQKQGKWKEAESEYLLAYEECKQLGKADADAICGSGCARSLRRKTYPSSSGIAMSLTITSGRICAICASALTLLSAVPQWPKPIDAVPILAGAPAARAPVELNSQTWSFENTSWSHVTPVKISS